MDEMSLFSSTNDSVVMPNITQEMIDNQDSLKSKDISEAILGEQVDVLLLPKETIIAEQNYIFDFSKIDSVLVIQKDTLKSLLVNHESYVGELQERLVQLYLYKKNGLTSIGFGDKYALERMIPLIKEHVFNNEIKVYKNFAVGKKPEEVESRDITKFRLNL